MKVGIVSLLVTLAYAQLPSGGVDPAPKTAAPVAPGAGGAGGVAPPSNASVRGAPTSSPSGNRSNGTRNANSGASGMHFGMHAHEIAPLAIIVGYMFA